MRARRLREPPSLRREPTPVSSQAQSITLRAAWPVRGRRTQHSHSDLSAFAGVIVCRAVSLTLAEYKRHGRCNHCVGEPRNSLCVPNVNTHHVCRVRHHARGRDPRRPCGWWPRDRPDQGSRHAQAVRALDGPARGRRRRPHHGDAWRRRRRRPRRRRPCAVASPGKCARPAARAARSRARIAAPQDGELRAGEVRVPPRLQWRLEDAVPSRGATRGFLGDVLVSAIDVVTGLIEDKAARLRRLQGRRALRRASEGRRLPAWPPRG